MRAPLPRRLRFQLERFLLRGTLYRLGVIAVLIVLVVLCGGTLMWWAESDGGLVAWAREIWWAFLRMTDPGYLGDDTGSLRRSVSTVLTVLGYVLFMGALIAIMTAWLHQTIQHFESGLTPVALRRHIVILGWSERTPEILADLLAARPRRLRHFLRGIGTRRMRIVVLAGTVDARLQADLRDELGRAFDPRRIILRGGNPVEPDHLDRCACQDAAAVVVAGGYVNVESNEARNHDARLLRILLALRARVEKDRRAPQVIAPVADLALQDMLHAAYPPDRLLTVPSRRFVGRLLAHMARQHDLAQVVDILMDQASGRSLYLLPAGRAAGNSLADLTGTTGTAVIIGLIRDGRVLLAPLGETRCTEQDSLIVIAADRSLERTQPPLDQPMATITALHTHPAPRSVAICGYSRLLPILVVELLADPAVRIRSLARSPGSRRQQELHQLHADADDSRVEWIEADEEDLARLQPAMADVVVLLSSDRMPSAEEADARTLLLHQLLLQDLSAHEALGDTRVVMELRSPNSADLLDPSEGEFLFGGEVVSHTLAQVTLRHELLAVYDELFAAGGASIRFASAVDCGLRSGSRCSWAAIARACLAQGSICIGMADGHDVELAPDPRTQRLIADDTRIIILSG
ncbi:MAG: CASTOR/POLLUX-related putative ion channel [Planctomycetota bacterium]